MSNRVLRLAGSAALVLGSSLTSAAFAQLAPTSVTLAWTAPGDDGSVGQASRYDLRRSVTPITNLSDFAQATAVTGTSLPQPAGSSESVTVAGLTPETRYWFALRTLDEAGNLSGLSNVISATTLASSDTVRPAPLVLSLVGTTTTSATLSWTDVGDDSLTGTATAVEIRWATTAITEANWSAATVVFGVPQPGPPGTPQQFTVAGLDRTRDLWFAARARDDVNRVSALPPSLFVARLLDTAPPSAPDGLAATLESGGVRLRWSANSEPDLAGYHVYRAFAAAGPFSRLTTAATSTNGYLDAGPPDTLSVWYAVSAVDATSNESARSASLRVYLRGGGITAWNLSVPFPNPSRAGGPVSLPIEVPAAGPYDAVVEIQDGAGQHVRTLRVANASPGAIALVWDGMNDAGHATVPGVYRAWLRAGEDRQLVRFVRTP